MYKYQIGYSTWEESSYVELYHEQKFTEDDITNMVAEAIYARIEYLKANNAFSNDKYMNKFSSYWDTYTDTSIPDWLIKNKGFVKIEYDLSWSCDGWECVFKENSKDEHIKKIAIELKKMAICDKVFGTETK